MAKMIVCKRCGAEFHKGYKRCPQCGKKIKSHVGLVILLLIIIAMIVVALFPNNKKEKTDPVVKSAFTWPDTGIALLLPEPDITYGIIKSEQENSFEFTGYDVTRETFDQYINNCKKAGFTEDYYRTDKYYSAKDQNGNSLSLDYNEKKNELNIRIYAPKPQTETADEKEPSEQSPEESKAPASDTKEPAEESKETSPETEVPPEETKEPAKETQNITFRKWVDDYESLMNEYIDILTNLDYSDPNALSKYMQLLEKYEKFFEESEALNEDDYSIEDWAYYMDAIMRIEKKMIGIQ